jgi:uncharacterized protein (TIGR00288 family)
VLGKREAMGLRSLLGGDGGRSERRVGLFVDGPNVFRDEFDVDLQACQAAASEHGRLTVARLYVDEHATPGLTRAAEVNGFEVVTTSGDVDVRLATDATEFATDDTLDTLVVVSRDADFKPVLEAAARNGLRTVALSPGEHGQSEALASVAHVAESLDE